MTKKDLKTIEKLAKKSFINFKLDETKVKRTLLNAKKLSPAQSITFLDAYLKELKKELQKTTLIIRSFDSMPQNIISSIQKKMSSLYTITQTDVVIDKTILGGFILQINDLVIDCSVKNRITQVKKAIYA